MNYNDTSREIKLERMLIKKLGKRDPVCYVYMSGEVYKEVVRICYYWSEGGKRTLYANIYPSEIINMSDEEITEMFFLDWVFRR